MLDKLDILCGRIVVLREMLHAAIDKGNSMEILSISEELDIEIVMYMKEETWLLNSTKVVPTEV